MRKIQEYVDRVVKFFDMHLGKIVFTAIVFAILFCVLFWKSVKICLQFCDRRPESISVIVTVLITFVTGLFTIFQAMILKRKGKIRAHTLYNSIAVILKMNKEKIINTVEKYPEENKRYIALMTEEWMIDQETVKRVYELEKLLYEHGKFGDVYYTQRTIEVIASMNEFAHVINIAYSFLKEKDSAIVKDLSLFNKLKDKLDTLENVIETYRTGFLKKYIQL